MERFSIVIPQYNLSKMTENLINLLSKNTFNEKEVIIVDNGSSDIISKEYQDKVKYIRNDKNNFFAKACNIGSDLVESDIICFLNNDIEVGEEWDKISIELLLNYKDCGIVGSKLLYPNGLIQHAGVQVIGTKREGDIFDHRYMRMPHDYFFANKIREYQSVTGACIFLKKEDFFKVGKFSEEYINGYEDNDLCFKFLHNINKKIVYNPFANITHFHGKTERNEVNKKDRNNHDLFFNKWGMKLIEDKSKWDSEDNSFRGQ